MRPVVIRTTVHLKDDKGWEKEIVYPGDYGTNPRYILRKRFRCTDVPLPITKHPVDDYPTSENLKSRECEFRLQREDFEIISGHYYFKHMYFEEE